MKYKVGDKVRIKSLDWYNENKSKRGNISFPYEVEVAFTLEMSSFCGQIVTISQKGYTQDVGFYRIREDNGVHLWTDEMIEGLVEEETKFGTVSTNANCLTRERIDELATKIDKELPSGNSYEWDCPEGYIFKDENGNVINATKIVLEKNKNGYPKTYDECCFFLHEYPTQPNITGYKYELLHTFRKLLICRDAYWKIAGEEMGLGKPWEPDWKNPDIDLYVIINIYNRVEKAKYGYGFQHCTFSFPTPEMRDAFYENFKNEIEQCKELL